MKKLAFSDLAVVPETKNSNDVAIANWKDLFSNNEMETAI